MANTHRLLLRKAAALYEESMDFPFCLFIAQELIQTMNLSLGSCQLNSPSAAASFGCVMGTSERCRSVRNNTVSMFTFP